VIAALSAPAAAPDARVAAARARDAWLSGAPGIEVVLPSDARADDAPLVLEVGEPEAAPAPDGLGRAAALLLESGASRVEPAGFWAGGPRAIEPYVTMWEFEEVARRPWGPPVAREAKEPAAPAALVRRRGGDGRRLATGAWTIHSFAGRRAHPRPQVAALVPTGCRRVLDVGCGEGLLGAVLESRGARVTGVEPDAAAARAAETRLSCVVARPLEQALGELHGGFEAVVLADVLEHLRDPVEALRALHALAAEDAVLVASLPNASHAAVLGGTLQGRWDLALEGIVADDHLTWAGGAGWRRLLAAGGFHVERAEPLAGLSPDADPWARALAAAGLPESEAATVQWLFVARRGAPAAPIELGPAAEEDDLAADPVVAARSALAAAPEARWERPNAVFGGALEPLLAGEIVRGPGRGALTAGFTRAGLLRRFAHDANRVEISLLGEATLPPDVRAAADAARRAGLSVDGEALAAPRLSLTVRGAA
jgi:SAM-dependent methyltransferase